MRLTFIIFLTATWWAAAVCAADTGTSTYDAPPPDAVEINLTLEEAIDMALTSNRPYLSAVGQMQSHALDVTTAADEFSVKWAPNAKAGHTDEESQVGAGVAIVKKFQSGLKARLIPWVASHDEDFNAEMGMALEVPLMRGRGKTTNLDPLHSAEFSYRSADRALYDQRVNLVLETVGAVYEIVRQRELLKISITQLRAMEHHSETAKIREKIGLASPMDVYRAEIRQKDAEGLLTANRKRLSDAKDRLKLVLALPLDTRLGVSAPVDYQVFRVETPEAVETALEHRIERVEARETLTDARRRSEVARDNVRPEMNLVLRYDRFGMGSYFDEAMGFGERRYGINLESSTDWARTAEKAAYQQSLINVGTARLRASTVTDEIAKQVRQELTFLKEAEENIKIHQEQVLQAQGKLSYAQVKFTHGMADNFDVIEAQTEVQQAQMVLLGNHIDYIQGVYKLKAVMGTLIEERSG